MALYNYPQKGVSYYTITTFPLAGDFKDKYMRNNVAQKRHKKFIQTGFLELVSLLVNEAIYFHLKKCKTLTCSSFLTWPRRSFVHSPASPLSTLSNYAVIFSAHRTPQVYSLCLRAFAHPDNSSCPPSTTTSVHLKWFL